MKNKDDSSRISPQIGEFYYDIEDLDNLKRVLLQKKAASFYNLGKFYLINDRIRFEPDINLRNNIWVWGYHNMEVSEREKTSIFNILTSGKKIILDGFGKVYIWFQPSFERWNDFRGTEFIPPKPFLKFQVDQNFLADCISSDYATHSFK